MKIRDLFKRKRRNHGQKKMECPSFKTVHEATQSIILLESFGSKFKNIPSENRPSGQIIKQ
jgi:hypothetical protein